MSLVLVVLFIALPFAELAVIVASADAFGLGWTFLALVGFSVLGGFLVRREGATIWRRANQQLAMGAMPGRELLDGALVLAGGALLLTPGFITDTLGLLLLFPPTRLLLRPLVVAAMARRAARMMGRPAAGRWASETNRATGPHRSPGDPPPSARIIDLEVNPPERDA